MLQNLAVLDEVKTCPHCQQRLSCCEAPPFHIGDGLGWGSDVLFICLNDACSLFLKGWDQIEQQYGHHASYRYMELPGSKEGNYMMVGNADAFKACVINKETLLAQNEQYQKQCAAAKELETCVEDKNMEPIMFLLLEEAADITHRRKALACLEKMNDLQCIDPIRNHKFRNPTFEHEVNSTLSVMLKNNFKKECPHCGELIKMQAKKCMHCKEDLQ